MVGAAWGPLWGAEGPPWGIEGPPRGQPLGAARHEYIYIYIYIYMYPLVFGLPATMARTLDLCCEGMLKVCTRQDMKEAHGCRNKGTIQPASVFFRIPKMQYALRAWWSGEPYSEW